MNLKKRINWSPIIITVILLAIGGAIWFFASQPSNNSAPTTTNTPIQTAPVTPTTTTEPGIVILTAEELISQVIQNPDKYKKGTVIQVTGAVSGLEETNGTIYLQRIQGWQISVRPADSGNNDFRTAVIKGRVNSHPNDFVVTVRATLHDVSTPGKDIDLRDGTLVTDANK